MTERKDPEALQAVVEQLVHTGLERAVEVDHHVATEDHIERVERAVLDEVVRRPHDVVGQLP